MDRNHTVFAKSKSKLIFGAEWGLLAAFFLIFLVVSGCSKQQAAPPPRVTAIPVVVAKVTQRSMPVQLTAIGNVGSYAVSVEAQVPGELLEVHFKEGGFVHKGELLFTIDPRPYEAALAQVQATLLRDKAVAANSRAQAQRISKLLADGVVSPSDADASKSAADAAEATVAADEAALRTAQLNLEYCKIYSPLDGRTGSVVIKPGNLVKVADVPIVVIRQVSPIHVDFTVPQEYLPDIKKYMAAGPLRVEATVPSSSGPPEVGTLTFVDNTVDTTTGTIHLRATFENSRGVLWPGLYVNTLMTLSQQSNATVIPSQAITAGQQGSFVYIVQADGTVAPRPVASSRTVEGLAVIDKGLKPGETVVTDGQVRLVPGSKVLIKNNLSD
ncbi:MAG: efflux RND transporter periplasmic adaptor subunit [Acidobacteria bacterium]|nr:MAG: efflux RND transporter periplasmic adaptor subunit [Acidobacteriota bacterium]